MIRIFVEIDETNDYVADETKVFAGSLATNIKKRFNRRLYDIESGKNWFVGFIKLDSEYIDKISSTFEEWAEYEGLNTYYSVEDMDKEGHLCNQNNGVCTDCPYSYNGEPCKLGCTEA